MNMDELEFQEQVVFRLRTLFEGYGYRRYKMNKFEEYDLYAGNKDFLLSDSVITFTDHSGKLMALKPDVTLSIVKNSQDDTTAQQKLFYNEMVYRVEKGGFSFREMPQLGLECIGDVDDACILEVLMLAAGSLKAISEDAVLVVSHLGILSNVLAWLGISGSRLDTAMRCIGEKNSHELAAFCRNWGVPEDKTLWLNRLLASDGDPKTALMAIRDHLSETDSVKDVDRLIGIFNVLEDRGLRQIIRFDFSAVDNIRYYNGIVFKGYIRGLPSSILSGGQYDHLMEKLHRRSSAIGFAVYIDRLEPLEPKGRPYDVDAVLLYEEATPLSAVIKRAEELRASGRSVMLQRQKPVNIRYRQLLKLQNGEVKRLEDNA